MSSNNNPQTRYGWVAQSLHWVTAVLVGTAYLLGEGGPESRVYSADRAGTLTWHETVGMLVLALVALWLLWRLVDHAPEEPPMPTWMLYASKAMHWLLYVMLVAIPLTAITGAWYLGHPVSFLGVGLIGPLGSQSLDLGRTLTDLHTNLGSFIVWVAGVHAAAALFHHFILRDSVLLAMLPVWLLRERK